AAGEVVEPARLAGDIEKAPNEAIIRTHLDGVPLVQERERIAGLADLRDLEIWQEGGFTDVREAADRYPRQTRHAGYFRDAGEAEPRRRRIRHPREQIVADSVVAEAQLVDAVAAEHLGLTDRDIVRPLFLRSLLKLRRANERRIVRTRHLVVPVGQAIAHVQ